MESRNPDAPSVTPAISPRMWEGFFREFQAPLFVEDVTEVLAALDKIRKQGVTDLGPWLDAHPDFITKSLDMTRILDVSDYTIQWAGASSREELLNSLDRMILPETLPALKTILIDLFEGRGYYSSESQYRTLDGRHLYTWNNGLLPRRGDKPALLFLATTEITDLKQSQLELITSRERYSLLIEAAQDVILSHDLGGKITFINQVGLDLTGWSRDSLIGQDLSFLFPERAPDENRRTSLKVLSETRGRSLYEAGLVTRDGRSIPVEVSATIIPGHNNHEGQPQVLAMIRDITERQEADRKQRELEDQLKNTQKLESLGMLAGGIAHDFNNLLVTIMGHTELLSSGKQKKADVESALGVIMEASTQAADLCRQMQAYAGQTVAHLTEENLNSILENMSRLLQVSVSGKAHLNFVYGGDIPLVEVDPGQIRQVVMNLVTNAAESLTDQGGEISVRTGYRKFEGKELRRHQLANHLPPGSFAYCEVKDAGRGMTTEARQRLFDPFYTTKPGKRGLGMSTALGIVQGHKGGFLVESVPGDGTVITFLLPESQRPGRNRPKVKASRKAPDNLHLSLKNKTVLTVDEDAAVRAVGEGFLRRLGCRVLSAGNGPDAVRIFGDRQQDIDTVLLDLTMEGMGGVETCRRLRAIRPDLPIVFASGFSSEEVEKRAAGLEPYAFVPKPFRLVQMRRIMATVLGAEPES